MLPIYMLVRKLAKVELNVFAVFFEIDINFLIKQIIADNEQIINILNLKSLSNGG